MIPSKKKKLKRTISILLKIIIPVLMIPILLISTFIILDHFGYKGRHMDPDKEMLYGDILVSVLIPIDVIWLLILPLFLILTRKYWLFFLITLALLTITGSVFLFLLLCGIVTG